MLDPTILNARAIRELTEAEYEQNEAPALVASFRLLAVSFLISGAIVCAIIWSAVA
jgi:hypothetical protein